MIDTIKGNIDLKNKRYSDFEHLFEKGSKTIKENCITITFNLSNLKITIRLDNNYIPDKLFFNGSLSKFYYGNNLAQLDWGTTTDAIQLLSDSLDINMSDAALNRVDFGVNINVENPVHNYICCLLAFPRLSTIRYRDSVTFYSDWQYRTIIFYDKLKEIKNKDKGIYLSFPELYREQNILRYELQLKKSLKLRLGLNEVQLKDLNRDTVQKKLVCNWLNSYYRVEKFSFDIDPIHLIDSHNGILKYLAFHGAEKLGYDRLNNTISELKFDVKNSSIKRSKMKATVKGLLKNIKESTLDNNLVDELDNKIRFSKDLIF